MANTPLTIITHDASPLHGSFFCFHAKQVHDSQCTCCCLGEKKEDVDVEEKDRRSFFLPLNLLEEDVQDHTITSPVNFYQQQQQRQQEYFQEEAAARLYRHHPQQQHPQTTTIRPQQQQEYHPSSPQIGQRAAGSPRFSAERVIRQYFTCVQHLQAQKIAPTIQYIQYHLQHVMSDTKITSSNFKRWKAVLYTEQELIIWRDHLDIHWPLFPTPWGSKKVVTWEYINFDDAKSLTSKFRPDKLDEILVTLGRLYNMKERKPLSMHTIYKLSVILKQSGPRFLRQVPLGYIIECICWLIHCGII